MDHSRSRTAPRPLDFSSAARRSPWPARTARRWIVRRASEGGRWWTFRTGLQKAAETSAFASKCKMTNVAAVIRDGPKDQTSGAQLRTGESRDSGFDASHRPGMTECQNGLMEK